MNIMTTNSTSGSISCTDTSKHTSTIYNYDINLPAGPSS